MKSIFTLFIVISVANFGFAQPIISNVVPNYGDQLVYNQADIALSPGAAGANITWDFSDSTVDEYSANYTVSHPDEVEGSDQFPDATMVWVVDLDFLVLNSFISFANNKFTDYGSVSSGMGINSGRVYDNPEVHFAHPLNYEDTGSDTYDGSLVMVGNENPLSGESSYIIDGYGTIITPYGTYENVLRITSTKVENFTALGSTVTSNITETSWYSQDYPMPVFMINSTIDSGSPTEPEHTATALVSYSGSTGVDKISTDKLFGIYPNPAADHITISSDFQGLAELKIFSVDGKIVANKSVRKNDKINMSHLQSGYYIARIFINGKPYAHSGVVIK